MRAGPLDKRVSIERKTETRNQVGDVIETWAPVFPDGVWAQRTEGSKVAERFAGSQRFAEVTTIFRVRWSPAYDEVRPDTHRLVWKRFTYNILGAVELGRQDGVELLCVARGE